MDLDKIIKKASDPEGKTEEEVDLPNISRDYKADVKEVTGSGQADYEKVE